MLFLWFVKTFPLGCQEKQTPVPRPILGKRSKFCDSRSKSLSSFCSGPPWSVTLFYIKRSCLVSWRTWGSDAPTLPYPSTSELFGLESAEDEYRCGNRIILAIDIVLKSKDFGDTLSLVGNYITGLSCLCCQVLSFRCTFGQQVRFMSKLLRPHLFLEM